MPQASASRALRHIALASAAFLVGATALYGWQAWRKARAGQLSEMQTVLALTHQSIDRYFVHLRLALGELASDVQPADTQFDLPRAQSLLARFAAVHPELRAINLLNMEGQMLANSSTTRLTGLPSTANQRDWAAIRKTLRSDEPMVLARPLLGPVVQQWILPIRYTLRNAAGEPIGYLLAAAPVEMLQGFWRDAPILAKAHISVVDDDGYLITRYPLPAGADPAVVYGQPRSGALREYLVSHQFPQSGYAEGPNVLSKEDTAAVFRRLDHLPLTLAVVTPLSSFTDAWWERMRFVLVLSALSGLAGLWAYRRLQLNQQRADADHAQHRQDMATAMARLTTSEQQLQHELDRQLDTICRVDAKGLVQFVNLAYCRAFGVEREAFTGGTWHNATVAEDVPAVERRLALMTPQSPECQAECRMHMADGSVRWYQWSNRANYDGEGRLIDLQGVGRDITDRKALEERLAQALAEMTDLYEHSPQGLHSLGPDGVFLRINDTELGWLGRCREDVVGKLRWLDVCTPEGAELFKACFPSMRAGQPVQGLEFTIVAVDGSKRRVLVSGTPMLDEAGAFVMSRTVVQDVEALRASQERATTLSREVAAMLDTDIVAVLRLKGRRIEWANRGATRIFGYSAEELIGHSARQLFDSDEDFEAAAVHYEPIKQGGSGRFQSQRRHRDGRTIWVDAAGVSMTRDHEETMWVMADITELKQSEAARLRAVELAAESRQMHEASRLKGMFLANVTHELRTPLNAVLGLSHVLQSGRMSPDSPKYTGYLAQIGFSGRQLLGLIDTMLDAVRLDAGRLEFHPCPVDLPRLIESLQSTLEPELLARRVTLRVDVPLALDLVLDPLRLEQMLFQLVGNAVKFSPTGGEVVLRIAAEGDAFVRFEVKDQGIGIAPDDQSQLFSDFRQLSEGITKSYQGLGMGLALVRRIVEAQGGTVGVRSIEGQGSVFFAVLPRAAPASIGQPDWPRSS